MSYAGECMFGDNCFLKGQPVDDRHAAYPITGFELPRDAGGANRILARKREPGKVAHRYCAEQFANGVTPGQRTLL